MTRYAGSRDYVGTPQSPQKTPHRSKHPTEKQTSTLSQEFCAGYLLLQNFTTRTECLRKGRSLFFSGMYGSVWGLLRRLRRTSSYDRSRRVPRWGQYPRSVVRQSLMPLSKGPGPRRFQGRTMIFAGGISPRPAH